MWPTTWLRSPCCDLHCSFALASVAPIDRLALLVLNTEREDYLNATHFAIRRRLRLPRRTSPGDVMVEISKAGICRTGRLATLWLQGLGYYLRALDQAV